VEDLRQEEIPVDATTLIYLGKADAFGEAVRAVRTFVASPAVWREAVDDAPERYIGDVRKIRAAEQEGAVKQVALGDRDRALASTIRANHRLGQGESEALALAHRRKYAIVDEGRATRVARALGLIPYSTLFLPVLAYDVGELDKAEAKALFRRLAVVAGARAEVVVAIEEYLEEKGK